MTDASIQLARELAALKRKVETLERAPRLRYVSLENTDLKVFDGDGVLRQIIGLQPDGTFHAVAVNGSTPPTPSTPVVVAHPGTLVVTWDGLTASGVALPADFARVEVHVSTSPAFTPTDATQIAEFTSQSGGSTTIAVAVDTYFVALVMVTVAGAKSVKSAEVNIDSLPVISDGLPPATSPDPIIKGNIGSLIVSWLPVVNVDAVDYDVYVSDTTGFTPDPTNKAGTGVGIGPVFIRGLPSGAPMVAGTTYYVRIIARDYDGPAPAPGAEGSGTPVQVTGPDIAVNAISADHITSNAITAGKLEAVLALIGQLVVGDTSGRSIKMDPINGFRVYDNSGATVFAIPTNLIDPISATANFIANTLTATGKVSMQDEANELAPGAGMILRAGTSAPGAPPVVTTVYAQRPVATTSGYVHPAAVSDDGSLVYAFGTNFFQGPFFLASYIRSIDLTTGVVVTVTGGAPNNVITAMTKISSTTTAGQKKYAALFNVTSGTSSTGQWYVGFFDVNFAPVLNGGSANWFNYAVPTHASAHQPGMAFDGTNLVFIQPDTSTSPVVYMRKFSLTGTAVGAAVNTGLTLDPGSTLYLRSCEYGSFDYGSGRIATLWSNGVVVVFSAAGAVTWSESWPTSAIAFRNDEASMFWNPTSSRFELYDAASNIITTFGPNIWTSSTYDIQRLSFAWGDASSGVTPQSPRAQFYGVKRGTQRVSLPAFPAGGIIDRAHIYAGYGAKVNDAADRLTMFDQGYTGTSTSDVVVPNYSGTNPSATTTIAGESPSQFLSDAVDGAANPLIQFKGDGSYRLSGTNLNDIPWTNLTMGNSWVNYGSPEALAQYCRVDGIVYVKGAIKNGTLTATIATLPAGCRPAENRSFAGTAASSTGSATAGTAHTHGLSWVGVRLQVTAGGVIANVNSVASNGYLSLDGICFPAEA